MELILASTSPYRRKLLESYGLTFKAIAPKIDEEALKDPKLSAQVLCETLAQAKAESLMNDYPNDIIIGSDQIVSVGDEILGKAGSPEKAIAQLEKLSGKEHCLITSMSVLMADKAYLHTDATFLKMRPLTHDQLTKYVHHDEPWDCAGSYKLEKSGLGLFSEIKTKDHTAIIGLPLIALTDALLELDYKLPFL